MIFLGEKRKALHFAVVLSSVQARLLPHRSGSLLPLGESRQPLRLSPSRTRRVEVRSLTQRHGAVPVADVESFVVDGDCEAIGCGGFSEASEERGEKKRRQRLSKGKEKRRTNQCGSYSCYSIRLCR
jgi:hypothetical protein